MSSRKRRWEREGGAPSFFNKGPISNLLREVGDKLLWEAQHGNCILCGNQLNAYDRDHVRPFGKSHDDSLLNARLAHPKCNGERGAEPLTAEQQRRVDYTGERLEALLTALLSEEKVKRFTRRERVAVQAAEAAAMKVGG